MLEVIHVLNTKAHETGNVAGLAVEEASRGNATISSRSLCTRLVWVELVFAKGPELGLKEGPYHHSY